MVFGLMNDAVKSVANPTNIIKNKGVNAAINSSLNHGKKRGGPFSHIPEVQALFAQQQPKAQPKAKPKAQPKAQPKAKPKTQPKPKGKWVTNEIGVQVWHPPSYVKGQNEGSYFYDQMKRKDNNTYGGHTSTNLMAYYG